MNPDRKTYPHTEGHQAKGDWNPLWEQFRELDPEFLEACLAFRSVPHREGPLPPKFKELILIAINAATTHLYGPGVRRHIQNTFKAGARNEATSASMAWAKSLCAPACRTSVNGSS